MLFKAIASSYFLVFFSSKAKSFSTNKPLFKQMSFIYKTMPWWGYIILTVLLVLFTFLPIHLYKKKAMQSISSIDPITVKTNSSIIIPRIAQHIGARNELQDSFAILDLHDVHLLRQCGGIAVLAEAMGEVIGGKQVSQLAVQTFLHHYIHSPARNIPAKLAAAIHEANEAVFDYARTNNIQGRVGSTLIATVLHNQLLYWISAGDSRIYLKKGQKLTQLTTDHMNANEVDDKGTLELMSEETAANPQRESLTSFIGLERLEDYDISMEPIPLKLGDSVILCSNDLYEALSIAEMEEICKNSLFQDTADALMVAALSKQTPNQDNITIVILKIGKTAGRNET